MSQYILSLLGFV